MALIDKHEKILWKIIQQRGGRRSGCPPLNDPGIVFNSAAKTDFRQHFQVVCRPLGDPLGLDQLVVVPEKLDLGVTFPLNFQHCPLQLLPGGNIVAGRIDGHMIHISLRNTGNGVDFADPVDLVPEEFDPNGPAGPVGGVNLQRIPPDPEFVSGKVQIVSLIADLRQFF